MYVQFYYLNNSDKVPKPVGIPETLIDGGLVNEYIKDMVDLDPNGDIFYEGNLVTHVLVFSLECSSASYFSLKKVVKVEVALEYREDLL